jgi:hypothetical protein
VASEQDTDVGLPLSAPSGFASVRIDQLLPFQWAVNGPPKGSPKS